MKITKSQCDLLPKQQQKQKMFDFIWLDYCCTWFSERDIYLALQCLRVDKVHGTFLAVTFSLRQKKIRMDDVYYYQKRVIDLAKSHKRKCSSLHDENYTGPFAYLIFKIY